MAEIRRWLSLIGHGFASMFDLLMLTAGSALIGLAITVLLDGFGVRTLALTNNAGSMFGSALLIAVFGSFALGVANEGPIGHGIYAARLAPLELAMVRALAITTLSLVGVWAAGSIPGLVEELPYPFELTAVAVEQVSRAGLFFALLIGVPATYAMRFFFADRIKGEDWELPVILVIWFLGAMILISGAL